MPATTPTAPIAQPDFRAEPAVLTWHDGKRYWVRTCYEFVGGKWEGFVSMQRADEAR